MLVRFVVNADDVHGFHLLYCCSGGGARWQTKSERYIVHIVLVVGANFLCYESMESIYPLMNASSLAVISSSSRRVSISSSV